ncbi:MAG: SUMF1/EgtB/PvdO family nonheme iron enzyme, partial [Pseudomonadota bacterium]
DTERRECTRYLAIRIAAREEDVGVTDAVFTRPIAAVEPCGMAETSISATQRDDLAGPAMRSIGDAVQRRSAGRKASCFIVVDVLRSARPLHFLCVRVHQNPATMMRGRVWQFRRIHLWTTFKAKPELDAMTDVFISYSRNDREIVRKIADALTAEGMQVWWDPEIPPGETFANVIDRNLKESACILVVWSKSSVTSNWVQEEADDGLVRHTLIPVMIDDVELPRGFKRLQTADLRGWAGEADDANWRLVLGQAKKLVAAKARTMASDAGDDEEEDEGFVIGRQAPAAAAAPAARGQAAAPRRETADEEKSGGGFPLMPAIIGLAVIGIASFGYFFLANNQERQDASAELAVQPPPAAPEYNGQGESGRVEGPEEAEKVAEFAASGDVGDTEEGNGADDAVSTDAQEAEELTVAAVDDDGAPDASGEATSEAIAEEESIDPSSAASIGSEAGEQAIAVEAGPQTPESDRGDSAVAPRSSSSVGPSAVSALAPGETFTDCEACPQMVVIPGNASYMMGAPRSEPGHDQSERPQVEVAIGDAFALGVYEVTFDDWNACVDDGGCAGHKPSSMGWGEGRRPVINVSVADAENYLNWLSEKSGAFYRLPSEAEWEYAARAGADGPFAFGSAISPTQANFNGKFPYGGAKGVYRSQTVEAGSFEANAFGLHDMHGNVWERVADCWRPTHEDVAIDASPVDGACADRVIKGGGWNAGGWRLRSAHRKAAPADERDFDTGFRVLREL